MTITALPNPPSTTDPVNFAAKADAFIAALPQFVTEVNTLGTSLSFPGLMANSTTSVAIGTGSKSFTINTGKTFLVGQSIFVQYTTTPTNWMYGTVTSYDSGTGALVMNVTSVLGSGTYALWTVSLGEPLVSSRGFSMTGLQNLAVGANIASAATLNLSTATGNTMHVTGTTTTTAVTMNTGQWMECIADGAWPLTYHATNNKLNTGGVNYTCAVGDRIFYFYDGTTVYGNIIRQDGLTPIAPIRQYKVLQVVHYDTGAVATGTTTIPADDTVPQNTEGDQYMSLAITPLDAGSTLIIDVAFHGAYSAGQVYLAAALFRDSTASAIGVGHMYIYQGANFLLTFSVKAPANSTSATTFKLRAGGNTAGTMTFNGNSGARLYGGVLASSIRITEIAP